MNNVTKKSVFENHSVLLGIFCVIAGIGAGWSLCQVLLVDNNADKYAQLEMQNAELKQKLQAISGPYQKQLEEMQVYTKKLEMQGGDTQTQWQKALDSWKTANGRLQKTVDFYEGNCSVVGLIRDVQSDKKASELALGEAALDPDAQGKIPDLRRQIAEQQARILALQTKLSCPLPPEPEPPATPATPAAGTPATGAAGPAPAPTTAPATTPAVTTPATAPAAAPIKPKSASLVIQTPAAK